MTISYTSILIAVFAMGLSACSEGIPTEGDARQVFENMTNRGEKNLKTGDLELKSFKKMNAKEVDILGTKAHVIEFEAELSYPKGWNVQCLGEAGKQNIIGCMMADSHEVGATEVTKGEVIFEKTEKGWRGPDDNIY